MSKYLLSTTETYRVDSEAESTQLINEAKKSNQYTLSKYTSTLKEQKQKGEVVDSWYKVSLTKVFNSEKEPIDDISVSYGKEGDFE